MRVSRTVFPATAQRESFTHEDLLIIYNDMTDLQRAIYFDNEQHVIHYAVSISSGQDQVTLVSDLSPSAPRFRFTYIRTGSDTMEARFDIAPPGQPESFNTYLRGAARRLG